MSKIIRSADHPGESRTLVNNPLANHPPANRRAATADNPGHDEAVDHAGKRVASRSLHDMDATMEQLRRESRQQGFEEGLSQGRQQGQSDFDKKLDGLSDIIARLQQQQQAFVDRQHDLMVEIVYTAVCKIIGDLYVSKPVIQNMIQQCLAELGDARTTTVKVSPADAQRIKAQRPGEDTTMPAVDVVADPTITTGGVMVESDRGSLDARLDQQLTTLRDVLMNVKNQSGQGED